MKRCDKCEHGYFGIDGSCHACAEFDETGTCLICENKIESLKEHTCEQCGLLFCDGCSHLGKIKKEFTVQHNIITNVIHHELHISNLNYDVSKESFDQLKQAICCWHKVRIGDNITDKENCHVFRTPQGKWKFIYV
jgi:hypothetical protein